MTEENSKNEESQGCWSQEQLQLGAYWNAAEVISVTSHWWIKFFFYDMNASVLKLYFWKNLKHIGMK